MGAYLFFSHVQIRWATCETSSSHKLNCIAPDFEVKLDCNCRIIIKVIAM
jgi:hypothetical protein